MNQNSQKQLSPELIKRLKAETKKPYRGLRKFFYLAFGISGFLGALIFLLKLLSGNSNSSTIPNLALQLGVIALMIFLFRLENKEV